jgi:MipA family protein
MEDAAHGHLLYISAALASNLNLLVVALLSLAADRALAQEGDARAALGGGVAVVPRYPGSDRHETRLSPVISVSFGRFFIGGDPAAGGGGGGVGLRLYADRRWAFGAALSPEFRRAREESDDPRLQGLGDVDGTVRATLFAGYRYAWLALRASVSPDIGGENQGTLARFDALVRHAAGERLVFSAGPGVTWASGQYMRTFFGIDAAQSARSGLPQYEAGRGWNSLRFAIGVNYIATKDWSAGARAARALLVGDAADSPVTASRSQDTFATFLTYRF